ncbi:unnamed protein product, partial [Meganyctiphanes norvegica]
MLVRTLIAPVKRFLMILSFSLSLSLSVCVLPEAPLDTPESNALLRTDDLPAFEELTPEKCYMGMGKLALEYEAGVWSVEEKIKKNQEAINFSNIIESLEVLDAPLSIAWSNVKTLYTVKNNEMTTSSYRRIHERARKARVHKFQSLPIYHACKDILLNEEGLNEAQQRVLRKYLLEARLNGIELSPDKRKSFTHTLNKLEQQKAQFRKKVDESSNRFAYRIYDPLVLKQFPEDLKSNMSSGRANYNEGPWDVTLQPHVYHKFLEYCPDPALRQNTWRAYNMRASNHLSEEVNNSLHITEIRSLRHEQANIIGYENFAQMSMETKMAGSVENVFSMITSIMAKSGEVQEKEIDSLQQFAAAGGHFGDLEPWDIAYWRRKQKRNLYNFEESQHKEFFPFDHVFGSLLEHCSQLFNISFEELEYGQVSTWHQDVRFFNILDSDGSYLASFYLDPYKRTEEKLYTSTTQAWMLGCRNRSDIAKTSPISTLVFNFTPPTEEFNNCLLTFSEVQILLKKFGHALQHLLTRVPYSEASGLTNIEWDAVEVCANFMQYWLYDPSTLQRISCHYESGLPLSGSSIKDIIASQNHMAAYDLCNELYLSHLDLQLHISNDFWFDITKELYSKYKPFKIDKYHAQPCSFTEIMTDIWGSAYYSSTWAKMLAADAIQTYNESTEDDVDDIGQRFRDTFLSLGGGCHPSEVFRRFRGRDPSPEALLTLHDINTTTGSS